MKMEELLAELIRTEIGPEHVQLAYNTVGLVDLLADGLKYRSDLIDDLCHVGAIPKTLSPDLRMTYLRMRGRHLANLLEATEENQQRFRGM